VNSNILLRTVFLQVPTIPNPVGVVGVVGVLEFWTWYRKVEETLASAYVLHPLKTSVISIYKRLKK
jgi:hypothetical protein